MATGLRITDVERITVDVPFTPRCQEWNVREIEQWRISEIIRVTTDVPDIVGYGETLPHYTWGRVPDAAIERVKCGNPADFLGDDSLGAGLQIAVNNSWFSWFRSPSDRICWNASSQCAHTV